jgi:hypothetical protein
MRIWDIPPHQLCSQHLLGEHRELHAVWVILTQGKRGYSRHPETLRWQGKLKALYNRHREQVKEMQKRGFRHYSPLDPLLANGKAKQSEILDSIEQQTRILGKKNCNCRV